MEHVEHVYKVVITFKCHHLNESYWAELSMNAEPKSPEIQICFYDIFEKTLEDLG